MNYSYSSQGSPISPIFWLFYIVIIVLLIVSQWKIYVKAGQPGWAAIIPIYNILILLKIISKPWWWILMFLIPLVNIVFMFMIYNGLSKSFGRSTVFTIFGLILFPFVGYPMLAFGSSKYLGPDKASNSQDTTPTIPVTQPINPAASA